MLKVNTTKIAFHSHLSSTAGRSRTLPPSGSSTYKKNFNRQSCIRADLVQDFTRLISNENLRTIGPATSAVGLIAGIFTYQNNNTNARIDKLEASIKQGFDMISENFAEFRSVVDERFEKFEIRFNDKLAELKAELKSDLDSRLDKIDERFAKFDERFEKFEIIFNDKLAELKAELKSYLGSRLEKIDGRFAKFDEKFEKFEIRFNDKLTELKAELKSDLGSKIDKLDDKSTNIEKKVDLNFSDMMKILVMKDYITPRV